MRLGVVGCGYWGSKHVRVLHQTDGVDQVAVIDPREERREALAKSFPSSPSFPDLDSALPGLDGVVIASPPSTHLQLALKGLQAGKHVLVEKPMTTTAAGARQLIDAAMAADLVLMVGHTFEYNAAVRKLREVVTRGELGKLYYIDTARLNLGLYQTDVNVIWDLAPHDVSIINYVLGRLPEAVQAWASCHASSCVEDVAYLRLRYTDPDITAQIHVSWLDPCKVRRVTVVGSQKMAVYDDLADEERIRIYDKGVVTAQHQEDLHDLPMSYRHGGISSPFIDLQEPLSLQDEHFVECIQNGKRPLSDGEDGLATVRVLEAMNRSIHANAPLSLDGTAIGWAADGGRLTMRATGATEPAAARPRRRVPRGEAARAPGGVRLDDSRRYIAERMRGGRT